MDDIAHRRKLEIEIDQLKAAKDLQANNLANEAEIALKEKKLQKAQDLVNRGLKIIAPTRLLDVLVQNGGMKSKADARRVLEAGGIMVDKRRAKDADMDVKSATSITIAGREIL